jgi:Mg2+-importing ATPase
MARKKTKLKINPAITKAERAKRRLLRAACRDGSTLLIQYDNNEKGFDEDDVEEMREEHGANIITRQEEDTLFKRLIGAFINPFTVVLLVLALISAFTDIILANPSEADPITVIIIMSMVIISGLLRFFQELRSTGAAKRLSEMVETTACAARKFED